MATDPVRSFRQYQERYLPSTVAKPETAEELGTRIAREALDALAAAVPCHPRKGDTRAWWLRLLYRRVNR